MKYKELFIYVILGAILMSIAYFSRNTSYWIIPCIVGAGLTGGGIVLIIDKLFN